MPNVSIADVGRGDRASLEDWIAVGAGTLGALMAVLDISIVNSSLPTIQGEIGATGSEGTWISTSFLAAEIIIIPLSAWLTHLLGLRRFLLFAASAFVAFSVVCGLSTNLVMMIVGRAGQGLAGGALIPTAFTIIATRLPPSQQPVGTAAFGATAILGPVFGPILGGWITEAWSWHYAFFINVPIGAILIALLLLALPSEKFRKEGLEEIDWFGVIGLIIGLSCLTVALEEGNRERWFESLVIAELFLASAVGFVFVAIGQYSASHPVLKLKLLLDRNFGSVFFISVIFGLILYGIIYLIPQFLSQISGYNALQAGYVVFLSGIPAMMVMPFVPLLFRTVDVRVAIAVGLAILGASCFTDTALTPDSAGEAFTLGQLMRGGGQAAMMLFLNHAAMSSVREEDAADASSLFNTARNLGGSIGLALLATFQEERFSLHQGRLTEMVAANDPAVHTWIMTMGNGLGTGAGEAQDRALRLLAGEIGRQSAILTFNDLFLVMGSAALLIVPVAAFLRPIVGNKVRMGH